MSEPGIVNKYGIVASHLLSDIDVELYSFRTRRTPEVGGLGAQLHFKNAAQMLFPKRIWHEWTEDRIRGLCEYNFVSWAGAGGTGKTDDAAFYSFLWWLADPINSTVVLTSTTKGMIRKRVWPVIQRLYWERPELPCDLIDSMTTMRVKRPGMKLKDEKSAIFGIAVKEGNTSKAAANIQGMHNKRVLVVIDEATDTPKAIFDVLANLRIGCDHFQVIVLGNPSSRFDEHGKFSEPLNGWNSVTVDTKEWETVVQLDGQPGLCQRFDAADSPRIKTDRSDLHFLIGEKDIEGAIRKMGENSPEYWKYYRGFWAPDGVCNTVLSEPMILKHDARGTFIWSSWSRWIAGLDPAFGGDACVLRFALLGNLPGGRLGVEFREKHELKADANNPEPVDYQLARQVIEKCKEKGVKPEDFGMDSTGTGRGIYAIVCQLWSPRVLRVEFGGKPSELPAGIEDERKASEVYDRRVTELWFSVREHVMSDQIRGMDLDTIKDFITRTYSHEKRVYVIQSKEDMRKEGKKSPDDGDACAVVIEVARQHGLVNGTRQTSAGESGWDSFAKEMQSVYEDAA